MGLNDKLKMAATPAVVENILAEGATFLTATPKTQRRWKSVAARRLKEMQARSNPAPKVEKQEGSAEPETPETGKVVNRHRKYRKA